MPQHGDREGQRRSSRLEDEVSIKTNIAIHVMPKSGPRRKRALVLPQLYQTALVHLNAMRAFHRFPLSACKQSRRTSLLLLQSELVPVGAHAIPKSHPELSLLLRRHGLPSLLNVCKGRVGDSVSLTCLLELRGDCAGRDPGGRRERRANEGGCAEHCDGDVSPMGSSGVIKDRSEALQWFAS